VPLNPIYLSNRAAAYSGAGQHEDAVNDAELAVAADPKFAKAWSRLGFAKFALGDANGSMEAYKEGIDAEGNGGSEAMKRGYETAKKRVEEQGGSADEDDGDALSRGFPGGGAGGMPDLASLAGMFGGGAPGGGAPGAGGAGGMPDLASLAGMFGGGAPGGGAPGAGGMPNLSEMMNNPMMRQMAQNLMSNPDMMNNLLGNPALRNMFGGAGGAGGAGEVEDGGAAPGAGAGAGRGGAGRGGMPDLSSLMSDPSIQEMARNLMGGGAGRGRGA